MTRYSFFHELMEFEKYMERRDELMKRKAEEDKKKSKMTKRRGGGFKLGFFEGLVIAYFGQIAYGPLSKLFEVWLASYGVR